MPRPSRPDPVPAPRTDPRPDPRTEPRVGLLQVPGGYLLRERGRALRRGRAYERAMAGAGMLLAGRVAAGWALQGPGGAAPAAPVELALLALAVLLLRYAARGTIREVLVLPGAGEIRLSLRSSRGRARLLRRVRLAEIESVFLGRSRRRPAECRLCLRLAGQGLPLLLVTGREARLAALHRRLAEDIRAARRITPRRPVPRAAPHPAPGLASPHPPLS